MHSFIALKKVLVQTKVKEWFILVTLHQSKSKFKLEQILVVIILCKQIFPLNSNNGSNNYFVNVRMSKNLMIDDDDNNINYLLVVTIILLLWWGNSLCYCHHLGVTPVALSPLWIFISSRFFIFFLLSSSAFVVTVCKIASSFIHNTWAFQPTSPLESSLVCRSALYCLAFAVTFAGLENRRKRKPNKIPDCLIPHLLLVLTRQSEILLTALILVALFHRP